MLPLIIGGAYILVGAVLTGRENSKLRAQAASVSAAPRVVLPPGSPKPPTPRGITFWGNTKRTILWPVRFIPLIGQSEFENVIDPRNRP